MQGAKEASFSLTIDDNLQIRSWSDECASVWKEHARKSEPCLLTEIIPLKKNTIQSIKRIFHNGKPLTRKGVSLPCPFGACDVSLNVHPLDTKNPFLGAKVLLVPTFTCHRVAHGARDKKIEDVTTAATTLAHGVRNPLNAIKGAVVYIRERYANEKKLVQFLDIIEEEISRLDTFIAHYLATSVNQRQGMSVDLNSILKKIEVLISFQVQSSSIKAVFQYGSLMRVKLNPFLIEQAILNVINNAIEAMAGGGRLIVRSKSVDYSGRKYALVEISDTGSGIAKIKDRGQSPGGEGRGFGLLITHEILRSVRGHLEIRSRGGKGTVVRLYFPLVER